MSNPVEPVAQSVSPAQPFLPSLSQVKTNRRPRFKTSLREKQFAKEYIKNGANGKRAMLAVSPYVKPTSAEVLSSLMLRKPTVIAEIWRIAEAQNADIHSVFGALGGGMQATKPLQDSTGAVVAEAPDHQVRIKAAVEAAKLLRVYPTSGDSPHGQGSRHLHLHVDDESGRDVLEGLADRQARRQRKAAKLPNDLTIDVQVVSSEETAKAEAE